MSPFAAAFLLPSSIRKVAQGPNSSTLYGQNAFFEFEGEYGMSLKATGLALQMTRNARVHVIYRGQGLLQAQELSPSATLPEVDQEAAGGGKH